MEVYTLTSDKLLEDDIVNNQGFGEKRQIGLSYGMLDEDGLPYEPVKLKTFSLCCN